MIGYVTLGTNNLARAATFYDALLTEVGAQRAMESERYIAWASAPDKPMLLLIKPFDGQPATVGNGVMVAFAMDSQEKVAAFYNKAIALGATDEGAPGQRGKGFYAAYCRDLDGNKLDAYYLG